MVCWIPLNVYNMLAEHQPHLLSYAGLVFICCHWIASASTLLNAVLYAGMNFEFRRQLRLDGSFLHCCKCHCAEQTDQRPMVKAGTVDTKLLHTPMFVHSAASAENVNVYNVSYHDAAVS